MHTLLARDVPAQHQNFHTPHLVLHYDPCRGIVNCVSHDILPKSPGDMRAPDSPQSLRRHANPQQAGRRPSMDVGVSKTMPNNRHSSRFGTMMRRLLPGKGQKRPSLPSDVYRPPLPSTYPGGVPPGQKDFGGVRPVSTPGSKDPQSPLGAYPMAVADSGDAVARITKFVNQKGDLPRGSSLPNFILATPATHETWYDTQEVSLVSKEEKQAQSHGSSSQSATSSRRRSRSVSALSESTRMSERPMLRQQKSARNLRKSREEAARRHNTTPESNGGTKYQSESSDEPPARPDTTPPLPPYLTVSELPADVPIPQHLTPIPQSPRSDGTHARAPSNDTRRTFDFNTIASAMRGQDEINLQTHEERLTTMEVKMMSLEYAISKIQSRLPAEPRNQPVSYRKPSTNTAGATEELHSPSQAEPQIKRKTPPPSRLPESALNPNISSPRSQSMSSKASGSTIRPLRNTPQAGPPPRPAPAPPLNDDHPSKAVYEIDPRYSPEVIVESGSRSPRRTSVTLLTIDHYSKLIALLQHEQSARKQLASELHTLQAEMTALRPLAHTPLGASYRSWQEAKSTTLDRHWVEIEEFRAGKPVSLPRSSSESANKENEALRDRLRDRDRDRGRPAVRPAEIRVPPPMPSPVDSDASSDASFGNAWATPAEEGLYAGRAF